MASPGSESDTILAEQVQEGTGDSVAWAWVEPGYTRSAANTESNWM